MQLLVDIIALTLFTAFATGLWCLSSQRRYIDEEKIRQEPSISRALRSSFLPARILSEKGKRMRRLGFVAIIVAIAMAALLIVLNLRPYDGPDRQIGLIEERGLRFKVDVVVS